jgi:hypothetical protein
MVGAWSAAGIAARFADWRGQKNLAEPVTAIAIGAETGGAIRKCSLKSVAVVRRCGECGGAAEDRRDSLIGDEGSKLPSRRGRLRAGGRPKEGEPKQRPKSLRVGVRLPALFTGW